MNKDNKFNQDYQLGYIIFIDIKNFYDKIYVEIKMKLISIIDIHFVI